MFVIQMQCQPLNKAHKCLYLLKGLSFYEITFLVFVHFKKIHHIYWTSMFGRSKFI